MKELGTLATRRRVLSGSVALGSALAMPAILSRPAGAAEFIFKMATTIPQDHPINPRAQQAAETINEKSGGRIKVEVFPGYVLGSSTSCLSQLRGGAIQLLTLSGSVLSTMVPVSTIYNAAFAFKTYNEVWAALDGKLGDYIRGKVVAAGMQPIGKHWDLGFRDMTTSAKPITSAADLIGLKIRVPVAPLFLSCFEALGAAPASINFDEVYSSLQTRLIDGEENDLLVIDTAKLYEVQKYCAVTGHIWDGYLRLPMTEPGRHCRAICRSSCPTRSPMPPSRSGRTWWRAQPTLGPSCRRKA